MPIVLMPLGENELVIVDYIKQVTKCGGNDYSRVNREL